jgi:hypothetical protein
MKCTKNLISLLTYPWVGRVRQDLHLQTTEAALAGLSRKGYCDPYGISRTAESQEDIMAAYSEFQPKCYAPRTPATEEGVFTVPS